MRDPGAVDEDVRGAEPLGDGRKGAPHIGLAAHVAGNGEAFTPAGGDLARHVPRRGLGHVQHGDAPGRAGEPQGDRPADAGSAPRHERDLVLDLVHRSYTRAALSA